jgi:hypothetical protein
MMAVVIPVGKLVIGLTEVLKSEDVQVRLRDTNTVFRDKVTGWTISGSKVKSLPTISPGHPLSQQLFIAIRAGRFVRVIVKEDSMGRKRKKYDDFIDSIIGDHGALFGLEE